MEVDTSTKAASPVVPSKRTFRWPTHKPIHAVQIQGTSTDVRSIAFNSDGSQFAVCCESSIKYVIIKRLTLENWEATILAYGSGTM